MPPITFEVARLASMATFLVYGTLCLSSPRMVAEFERYRLPGLRKLTGGLEILGALGLGVGHFYPPLTRLAAGGLVIMMVCGVATRLRIRDSLLATLPALLLLGLNLFLFLGSAPSASPGASGASLSPGEASVEEFSAP